MDRTNVDFAIVVALKEEYTVIATLLGANLDVVHPSDPTFYWLRIRDIHNHLQAGIVALVDDMGQSACINTTHKLLQRYKPAVLLNVGISGSLDSDCLLGDVVVPTFADNPLSKAKAVSKARGKKRFSLEVAGDPRRCTDTLVKQVSSLHLTHEADCESEFVSNSSEILKSRVNHSELQFLRKNKLIGSRQKIISGPVVSGDIVGASQAFKDFLKSHNRKFIALDMESLGFLSSADENTEIPRLIVRGISDFSDERKTTLDEKFRGEFRILAMSNALSVTKLFLTRHLAPPSLSQATRPALGSLVTDLHGIALSQYLNMSYYEPLTKAPLVEVAKLFRLNIAEASMSQPKETLTELLSSLIASPHPCPLRIKGLVGSGKTVLLQTLYLQLYRGFSDNNKLPVPFFIDIKRYDHIADNPRETKNTLKKDLHQLENLLNLFPEQPAVIFIDSIDHHAPHRTAVEQEIVRLLSTRTNIRSVTAVGVHSHSHDYRTIPTRLNNAERTIRAGTTHRNQREAIDFLNAVNTIWHGEKGKRLELARSWVKKFNIQEIDFLTAHMMLAQAASSDAEHITNWVNFCELYCKEYLQEYSLDAPSEALLDQACEMAHQYFIQRASLKYKSDRKMQVLWNLIHYHSGIQQFLIARQVVETLRKFNGKVRSLNVLNHVYPQPIDRLCKDIMNCSTNVELECIAGAKKLASTIKKHKYGPYLKAATQACYLVGRAKSPEAQHLAIQFLKDLQAKAAARSIRVDADQKPLEYRKSHLLYERTIFISLAYLGDKQSSDLYVERLIKDQDCDMLNRGFHLEYYQDTESIPDTDQMLHVDDLKPFPRTWLTLTSRIERVLNGGSTVLLEIELHTLLSLCQHRHAAGKLSPEYKNKIRSLMNKILGRIKNTLLRRYIVMLNKTFRAAAFPIGRIAEQLYALKSEKRAGWRARGFKAADCESVADHTFGAILLANLFLPDRPPNQSTAWQGYDKEKIMKYLFIHDFAEAFTGDLLPAQRDENARKEEEEWFDYLQMLSTYSCTSGLRSIAERWSEFKAKSNLNAKIAIDVDKLENLMQLYLYSRHGHVIDDFKKWEENLVSHIKTEAGVQILKVIQLWFGNDLSPV